MAVCMSAYIMDVEWGGGFTSAIVRHQSQTPCTVNAVRLVQQRGRRHEQACSREGDLSVQVMIRQIHSLFRIRPLQAWRAVLRAGETVVGRAERRFPDLAELV